MNLSMEVANLVSVLTGLLVLGACVLLWLRNQTLWMSLALTGQVIAVLCRFVLFMPNAFTQYPIIRFVWPLGGLVFAIGLAGHAWTQYEAAQRGTKS